MLEKHIESVYTCVLTYSILHNNIGKADMSDYFIFASIFTIHSF